MKNISIVEKLKNVKKRPVLLVFILIAVALSAFALHQWWPESDLSTYELQESNASNEEEDDDNSNNSSSQENENNLGVYITGAIKNPGVYFLSEGSRVIDVVNLAGGFTNKAAAEAINLAAIISDGMQINIPTKEEVQTGTTSSTSSSSLSSSSSLVNINTADATQLETLPGIGEATAQKIIADRTSNGRFNKIEDLKRVSGIGDAKFEAVKDLICV